MKNSKLIFLLYIIILLFYIQPINNFIFAQDTYNGGYEILFTSNSSTSVVFKMIPVSMPMSDLVDANGNRQYTLEAGRKYYPHNPTTGLEYDYNNTVWKDNSGIHTEYTAPWAVNYDGDDGASDASQGDFGRGIYKIIAKWNDNGEKYDTCWYEQDAGANYDCGFTFVDNLQNYGGGRTGKGLVYTIMQVNNTWGPLQDIKCTNFYLKVWDPYPNITPHVGRDRESGDFHYGTPNGSGHINYSTIPLDPREECNISPYSYQNHDYEGDKQCGNLSLNLTIDKNVGTLNDETKWYDLIYWRYVQKPLLLTILNGSTLTIGNSNNLILNTDPNGITGHGSPDFLMTVKSGGVLTLNQNSLLEANSHTALVLEYNSIVNLGQGSIIHIKDCASLCNYGAHIYRGGQIIYEKTHCTSWCTNPGSYFVHDSVHIILQDSAELHLGDNSTMTFDGPGAALILKPNSKIILGQNSNLIFQNGAHIFANNATFQSYDANLIWDGIYLSGNSNDTITNCTIENAANGVNITNKNSTGLNQPSTEISDCIFVDSANVALNYGVYCSNSSNVLINHNTFSSVSVVEGFASAILVQYCPAGTPDIIANSISNVTNGISVIQSSPYIEWNTINGQGDGSGIILDNSNGTLKYNTVNYFSKAIVTYYSSAYLFRNSLNNSNVNMIDLYQSSAPILRPINSGSTLRWLGGNNSLNGTPSGYGIGLNEASFPSLDSGFNNIVLNGSNYMAGDLFSNILPATYNYWGDRPPVDYKFVVSNGSVIDTPDYNGSKLPSFNGSELTDIGFGLFDTVFTNGSGNNPGADNLYIQAYENEISGNYLSAINQYKQVVTNYKTSNLVPAAISRIINCLEKKLSATGDYSQLQNYMVQIRNNNNIPYIVRELAEDFIIKSMVRQNLFQYSISNYDTMYVHNQGNHKGIHAMINKLCLMSMYHDTSGNHSNASGNQNDIKLSLLSLLTGKQITTLHVNSNPELPKVFKLYQNYPNPFNPMTKIKYDLPKEGLVTIKIYDIVGKEIFSISEYNLPGSHEITFDGSKYASGVYFYRIDAGKFTNVKKMVILK